MSSSRGAARKTGIKRVAALALLLAVFFLPLHVHAPSFHAKVATECVCQQGSRTVASLAPTPVDVIPILAYQTVVFEPVASSGRISMSSGSIRAPPSFAVL